MMKVNVGKVEELFELDHVDPINEELKLSFKCPIGIFG